MLAATAIGLTACDPPKPSPASPLSRVDTVEHALSGGFFGDGPHLAFSSPAVADLNADGVPDIVVAGVDGTVQAIRSSDRAVLWTRSVGSTAIQSSPTLADLGGDGKPDVVVGTLDGRVIWLDGPTGAIVRTFNQQAPLYCPAGTDCRLDGFFASPAVADINGDGTPDIIAPSFDSSVYAWSANGTLLWRRYLEDTLWSSPVVADIDNDGLQEIVLGGDIWNGNPLGVPEGGITWVLRRDGTTYPGYPRSTPQQTVWSSPAVGDMDGDGNLDIVVGTGTNWADPRGRRVDAFRARDRANLSGWPVAIDGRVLGSPTLSDMDGDGKLEVTFAADGGWVYAYNSAGQRLWRGCNAGRPDTCRAGYFTNGGTVVADVDGDGRQEVLSALDKDLRIFDGLTGTVENTFEVNTGNAFVQGSSPAVFELGGKAMIAVVSGVKAGGPSRELGSTGDMTRLTVLTTGKDLGRADWPQFHRDAARTGRYRNDAPHWAPFATPTGWIRQQFLDFVGRTPDAYELGVWTNAMRANGLTGGPVAAGYLHAAEFGAPVGTSLRIRKALWGAYPSRSAVLGDVASLRGGRSPSALADAVAADPTIAALSNDQVVVAMFTNLFGRAPTPTERSYNVGRLAAGTSRGAVVADYAEGAAVAARASEVDAATIFLAMLKRMPANGELGTWSARVAFAGPAWVVERLQPEPEYVNRVAPPA